MCSRKMLKCLRVTCELLICSVLQAAKARPANADLAVKAARQKTWAKR